MHNSKLFFNGVVQSILDRLGAQKNRYPSTSSVLRDLSAPALENLRKRVHEEFKKNFLNLINAHVSLIKESSVYNSRDQNYSFLPSYSKWIGYEQYREWHDAYRQIIIESVKVLEEDNRFYHTTCHYLVSHIYARIARLVDEKITHQIISWATYVFISLSADMQRKAIISSREMIQLGGEVTFPLHLDKLYDPELKRFISSWEDLRLYIIKAIINVDSNRVDEARLKDLRYHLKETTHLTCRAVVDGDRKAAEWLLDTFLRWNDSFLHFYNDERGGLLSNRFSYSYMNLLDDFESINSSSDREKLITISMKNLWFDSAVSMFGFLVNFAQEHNSELAWDISCQLFNQTLTDRASRLVHVHDSFEKAYSLLHSYIRLKVNDKYLDSVSDGLRRGFDSPIERGQVPGRPYVWWGGDYTYETFAFLFIVLSRKNERKGALLGELGRIAVDWLSNNGERYDDVSNSYSSLITAIKNVPSDALRKFVSRLEHVEVSTEQIKRYKFTAIANARLFKRVLRKSYFKNLSMAPVSMSEVGHFQGYLCEKVFGNISTKYPLRLFQNVEFCSSELKQKCSYGFSGVMKDLFLVNSSLARRYPYPDKDTYVSEYQKRVPYWPLETFLKDSPKTRIEAGGPFDMWRQLTLCINAIRAKGLTPIIFIKEGGLSFLYDWDWNSHEYDKSKLAPPSDYQKIDNPLNGQDGESNGYMYDLYGAASYETCLPHTYVVPKELLQTVKYRRYEDSSLFRLEYSLDEGEPYKGAIRVYWEYETQLNAELSESASSIVFELVYEDQYEAEED